MAERCGRGVGSVGRVHQVVHAALVRPPRMHSVAKEEAREKHCRQDQSSKHGNVRFDLRTFSFPSCDDIMILNAERLVIF
jgi:hypothetical protein